MHRMHRMLLPLSLFLLAWVVHGKSLWYFDAAQSLSPFVGLDINGDTITGSRVGLGICYNQEVERKVITDDFYVSVGTFFCTNPTTELLCDPSASTPAIEAKGAWTLTVSSPAGDMIVNRSTNVNCLDPDVHCRFQQADDRLGPVKYFGQGISRPFGTNDPSVYVGR